MNGIKIDIIGNIAKVIEKPARITSGTVGLPIEFAFDEQWDGLGKVIVFVGGAVIKTVPFADDMVVPWEVLLAPGAWLSVGVYGANEDGSVAIPTIFANVLPISVGADPEGDPTTEPTLPIWADVINRIEDVYVELSKYDTTHAVLFIKQNLTEEQKTQARSNIGAPSSVYVNIIRDEVAANTSAIGDIDTALDAIIALQNSIIGGESV